VAKRVLLLTQWFDPEPTFKGQVFARELLRQGFDVEVLTGFPNYPGGKLYPGYKLKWLQREIVDGVHITRVPLYPNHDQSAVKRVLNYASFAAAALIYGLFMAKRADVIYAYQPPFTVGLSAAFMRMFRGIPVVLDVQDMWPDTLRATGMVSNPKALSRVAEVCQWVYRHVDRVVVLSPGFKRSLVERGVPSAKLEVIYNWADEKSLEAPIGQLPSTFPGPDKFRIVFAGNMGKAQALDAVLDAAAMLQTRASQVCFVMIGGGVEVDRLKERAVDMQLSNFVFVPPVPMAEVGTMLHAADALLVHLRRDPLFKVTIPSKTQAYMAVGKPLLMAVDGDAADLVLHSGGGLVAESENPESLVAASEALQRLSIADRDLMSAKAKSYYQDHMSLTVGVGKFAKIFNDI
jgi:colanic acid biosynthesis glycosyl transferase WcaI